MTLFSQRLKELRQKSGKTQKDMAEFLGIIIRGYQRYEYGEGYPEVPGLVALADFFDVSTDYLLGRSDDPSRH